MPEPVKPGKILVIEDEFYVLSVLEQVLEIDGHTVIQANNGIDGLAAAELHSPDLILLDINMPGMNGYEVCAKLKAKPTLAEIPVIFLSGMGDTVDKVRGFGCGGVDYITKPFQLAEVKSRVETHLRLRRYQAEIEQHNRHLEELVQARTRELAAAHERLTILDTAKSDFLKLLAHEMRTPIHGLLGVSELLFDEELSREDLTNLRTMFENTRARIMTVLDDALLLAQIEVSGPDSSFLIAPHPLGPILATAIDAARTLASSRTVNLGTTPDLQCLVLCEKELLTKSLTSLLETAVKFSSEGSTVQVEAEVRPEAAILQIRASGQSIPEAALPKFFDVFSIGEALTPGGDLGLAPAVAHKVIALFNGQVSVANETPGGIVLTVRLCAPSAQDA